MKQSDNQIQAIIMGWSKQQIDNAHVALPGTITSYDPSSNRATVKPTGNFQAKDGRSLPYPLIYNAPIVFPSGSGGRAGITFPIKSGDGCLIVFSDESISGYLAGRATPEDPRKHSMNDAIVIPGLYPHGATSEASNPQETCMTCNGSIARMDASHFILELASGTTVTIDGSQFTVSLANGTTFTISEGLSGSFADGTDLTIGSSDLVVNGISHSHHTHPGIEPGPSNTGEPQ